MCSTVVLPGNVNRMVLLLTAALCCGQCRQLGSGQYGDVWLAIDKWSNDFVAIKTLLKRTLVDSHCLRTER